MADTSLRLRDPQEACPHLPMVTMPLNPDSWLIASGWLCRDTGQTLSLNGTCRKRWHFPSKQQMAIRQILI